MGKKEKKSTKDTERFIRSAYWHEIKKNKYFILCPIIFLLGYVASVAIVPIVYARFIEEVTTGSVKGAYDILGFALVLSGLYALKSLSYAMESRIFSRTLEKAQYNLSTNAFRHVSSLSKSFFADHFTGSLTSQLGSYTGNLRTFMNEYTYNLLGSVATTIVMLSYIATKSIVLVVPLIISATVYALLIIKNRAKMRRLNKDAVDAGNEHSGKVADSISGIETIKAGGTEREELKTLQLVAEKVFSLRRRSINFNNTQGEAVNFLNQFFVLFSICFAALLYVNGNLDLATVILMTSYASNIIGNVASISRFKLNMSEVYSNTSEIAKIMMMEPEIKDPEHPIKLKIKDGQIEFNEASFKYTNASEELKDEDDKPKVPTSKKEEQHLFENLNLTIKPGEKIGLVGPSGGGKSTLLKLILRFYDVDSGEIKIDGVNVKDVVQSKLRQQIAYVPQDPALFHRSIGENIGYSRPKATQEQIELAAKQAFADEFINTLPDGYETLVGERGVKLSGGQRQRVAIARAILKDAPILLLDEATSALDSESERFIQRSLEKLMKDRTTVVVAHRLSTIQKMDRILVIKDGRVVAQGPHEELLEISPLYKKLWSHQSGGMLKD